MIDYQLAELRLLSVPIKLGVTVRGADDLGDEFDAAIVATGAVANPLTLQANGANVMSWIDVLRDGAPQPSGSGRAVFIDDGTGFWWNYGVAEAIVQAGWQLTIVTPSGAVAHMIPGESVAPLLGRLAAGNSEFRVLTTLEAVLPGKVQLMPMVSSRIEELDCDLLVVQTGRSPVPGPAHALRAAGLREVHSIGDCIAPRRMSQAVFEAQRLARVI